MELILAMSTLLGGIAALWFFADKSRAWDWGKRRPDLVPQPLKEEVLAAPGISDSSGAMSRLPTRFLKVRPQTPVDPEDWRFAEGSPWSCVGDFFGTGERATARIVLDTADSTHKAIVVRPVDAGSYQDHVLADDVDPSRMYIRAVPPGTYKVSRALWKHGGAQRIFLPNGGIELGMYESAARVFYWDNSSEQFVEQRMSD